MRLGLLIMGISVVGWVVGFVITKIGPMLVRMDLEDKFPWLRSAGSYHVFGSFSEPKWPSFLGTSLMVVSGIAFIVGMVVVIVTLIAKVF